MVANKALRVAFKNWLTEQGLKHGEVTELGNACIIERTPGYFVLTVACPVHQGTSIEYPAGVLGRPADSLIEWLQECVVLGSM
jgi:hypothetical protein